MKIQFEVGNEEQVEVFHDLSSKVVNLMQRVREALFVLDARRAAQIASEIEHLTSVARKAESSCNASLLVGIRASEERLELVRCAQRCRRLGRIAHQCSVIVQGIQDIASKVSTEEIAAFKPIFLMAELELKDALLSILRDDEELAYGVCKKDEELDSLYAAEMERIFRNTSDAMFYNFHTGTSLLFILRAIERIGDHAKQLAVPSFYLLDAANMQRAYGQK